MSSEAFAMYIYIYMAGYWPAVCLHRPWVNLFPTGVWAKKRQGIGRNKMAPSCNFSFQSTYVLSYMNYIFPRVFCPSWSAILQNACATLGFSVFLVARLSYLSLANPSFGKFGFHQKWLTNLTFIKNCWQIGNVPERSTCVKCFKQENLPICQFPWRLFLKIQRFASNYWQIGTFLWKKHILKKCPPFSRICQFANYSFWRIQPPAEIIGKLANPLKGA